MGSEDKREVQEMALEPPKTMQSNQHYHFPIQGGRGTLKTVPAHLGETARDLLPSTLLSKGPICSL